MANAVKYKTFINFLKFLDCVYVHTKGSHEKWKHPSSMRPIIVPKKRYDLSQCCIIKFKDIGLYVSRVFRMCKQA
jgi:predicted RNA binding protein YcfA (HicA-like mRNA interferase family)